VVAGRCGGVLAMGRARIRSAAIRHGGVPDEWQGAMLADEGRYGREVSKRR